MIKQDKQQLWNAFDRSIDEQFLDARLRKSDDELSQALKLFYQQALTPHVHALHMLATHDVFANKNVVFSTHKDVETVVIDVTSLSCNFPLRIVMTQRGLCAQIYSGTQKVWERTIGFHARFLDGETRYDNVLNNLIAQSVVAVSKLDAAIEELNNTH